MQTYITNHKLGFAQWSQFTWKQLKEIAKSHGIKVGRNKDDTMCYLTRGTMIMTDEVKTFGVTLSISMQ